MTNIIEKDPKEEMQMHIANARHIINRFMPPHYVDLVLKKLPKNANISAGTVRNVKVGLSNRMDVLNAMVEVALENKKLLENFKVNTQKI